MRTPKVVKMKKTVKAGEEVFVAGKTYWDNIPKVVAKEVETGQDTVEVLQWEEEKVVKAEPVKEEPVKETVSEPEIKRPTISTKKDK